MQLACNCKPEKPEHPMPDLIHIEPTARIVTRYHEDVLNILRQLSIIEDNLDSLNGMLSGYPQIVPLEEPSDEAMSKPTQDPTDIVLDSPLSENFSRIAEIINVVGQKVVLTMGKLGYPLESL